MTLLTRREILGGTVAAALPPTAFGQTAELSFLVLGDWGRRGGADQRKVARQMAITAKQLQSQFVMTVGDNFYDTGVRNSADSHWDVSFRDVYDLSVLSRWHPALGNHDHDGCAGAQVAYRGDPAWQMDGPFYEKSVALPGGQELALFILDTSPLADARYQRGRAEEIAAQKAWFDDRVRTSKAAWKLVFGHHPIVTSGKRGRVYKDFSAWLAPRLRDYGVQAYVAGHEHHLELLRTSEGVTYIVCGAGSENDGLQKTRPQEHVVGWGKGFPGFAAFRLAGDQLAVDFMSPRQAAPLGQALITRDRTYPALQRAA